jgi:hypothetical protein
MNPHEPVRGKADENLARLESFCLLRDALLDREELMGLVKCLRDMPFDHVKIQAGEFFWQDLQKAARAMIEKMEKR